MDWSDVLKRDDLVGGDLQILAGSDVYRGRIKSVEMRRDGAYVFFELEYVFVRNGRDWKKQHEKLTFAFDAERTRLDSAGRNRIVMTDDGIALNGTVYPKEDSDILDPSGVQDHA